MAAPRAQTIQQRFGFKDNDLKTPQHDEIMLWLTKHMSTVLTMYSGSQWTGERIQECKGQAREKLSQLTTQAEKALEDYGKFLTWHNEYAQEHPVVEEKIKERFLNSGILVEALQAYTQDCLIRYQQGEDMPEPPPKPAPGFKIQWEWPIVDQKYKGKYVIGFVDMHINFGDPWLVIADRGKKPNPFLLGGFKSFSDPPTWQINEEAKKKLSNRKYWEYLLRQPQWDFLFFERELLFEVKTSISSLGELIRQIRLYQTYTDSPFIVVCPDARFAEPILSQGIGFLHCKPTFDGRYEIGRFEF